MIIMRNAHRQLIMKSIEHNIFSYGSLEISSYVVSFSYPCQLSVSLLMAAQQHIPPLAQNLMIPIAGTDQSDVESLM